MKWIFGALGLVLVSTQALAQWRYEKNVDAMTDKARPAASAAAATGEKFEVWRAEDGRVWFTIEARRPHVPVDDPGPMLRIDRNAAHTYDNTKVPGIGPLLRAEGRWISFVIWHGNDEEGRSDVIRELMQGKSLAVRYRIFPAGYFDTTVPLGNAGPAIARALGIPQREPARAASP